jgi:hypothetical protein
LPTSSPLKQFAEDPAAYLAPAPDALVRDESRFHLGVAGNGRHAGVCRLRLAEDEVEDAFAEIRGLAPEARTEWIVGPSSSPAGLEKRLRALGCRDQDPPLTSTVAALATSVEPPAVDGIEVRRVESYEDFLVGLEVSLEGWQMGDDHAQRARADAPETYARRRARPGGEWVAYLDGEPVAHAGAIAGPVGLFLTGGVTVPTARGHGAYRALVRARWDEAVRRGTPALAVHAEETSRPILEASGFERVCTIVELVSDP